MSDDLRGYSSGSHDHELLLAYLRGELESAEHTRLIERLAENAELRDALETLELAAQIAQDEVAARTADTAFERFATARSMQQAQKAGYSQGDRGEMGAAPPGSVSRTADRTRRAHREAASRSIWASVAEWMRRHATLMQPALAVLVIAQTGVIAHYVLEPSPAEAPSAVVRGAHGPCNDVWITFKDGTTEAALRKWLTLYGASIVEGPDGSGRYRIATNDGASRGALLSSDIASDIVSRAEAPQGCERSPR